jgi:hypothetical protein
VTILVLLAVIAFIGGIFYFIHLNQKKWFELSRQAAADLGCAAAPETIKTMTEEYEIFRWTWDGLSAELKTGTQTKLAGPAAGVPFTGSSISLAWPQPLPYELKIDLARLAEGSLRTGDAEFDGELSVQTSEEAAVRGLLVSPELRRDLRELFHSGRSLPTRLAALDQTGVRVQTYDKGTIRSCLDLAFSIAKRINARS